MDTDGKQIAIPRWLAQSIVPTAIIMALGGSFSMWRDVITINSELAHIKPRVEQLGQFAAKGERFTAWDGRLLEQRISNLETRVSVLERERWKAIHEGVERGQK